MRVAISLALALAAASCATPPTEPASAEVRAACVPPAAMPGVPVEDLYARCREAVFKLEPEDAPAAFVGAWGLGR